jgi:hypothetical protein
MSDTPRTDAAIAAYGTTSLFHTHIIVPMRQLERELAAAKEQARLAWERHAGKDKVYGEALADLAAARAASAEYIARTDPLLADKEKLMDDLAAAREENNALVVSLDKAEADLDMVRKEVAWLLQDNNILAKCAEKTEVTLDAAREALQAILGLPDNDWPGGFFKPTSQQMREIAAKVVKPKTTPFARWQERVAGLDATPAPAKEAAP